MALTNQIAASSTAARTNSAQSVQKEDSRRMRACVDATLKSLCNTPLKKGDTWNLQVSIDVNLKNTEELTRLFKEKKAKPSIFD